MKGRCAYYKGLIKNEGVTMNYVCVLAIELAAGRLAHGVWHAVNKQWFAWVPFLHH